ncbi:MAG: OmpH family outer membrane protein [candidate division NC10 bacterium]|nr:OmpH family outer membrane protein [candidate division NC10 bacterium]
MQRRNGCWKWAAVLAGAVVALAAWPVEGQSAQTLRIAVVDMQQILNQSARGKAVKQKLDQERTARQREMDGRQQELQKMQAELEKQAPVLSDQARRERTETLQRMARDIRRLLEDANRDFEKRVQETEMDITREIIAVAQEFGKDQGYTVVMERSTLIYFSSAVDVTAEVIKRFDGKQK